MLSRKVPICIFLLFAVALNVSAVKLPNPIEVLRDETGELKTLTRIYELSSGESDESIPKENFTENGVEYTFKEIITEEKAQEDVKEYSESITVNTSTSNTQKVIASFEPYIEVTTDDEYSGILELDYTTLNVMPSGYGKQSYTLSESRNYPNLSDADTSLVPKTIEKNGVNLSLTGISWQSSQSNTIDGQSFAVRYTANATYSGTGTKSYVKGYTATAEYRGEVKKVVKDTVKYTVIFEEVKNNNHFLSYWWAYLLGVLGVSGAGYGIYRIVRKKREGY